MGLHFPIDSLPHAEVRNWLCGPVRQAIPHQAALLLQGSEHSLGFSIEEKLCIALPEAYLAAISDSRGQLCSPLLDRWMRTREMQYFDLGETVEEMDSRWLRNFATHGLRNCALFGQVDPARRRLLLLVLYNLPAGARRPGPELCAALLEPLLSAVAYLRRGADTDRLTPAELEVLKWVRLGKTNDEIGMILGRSRFTVKTHIQRMLAKTGLDNRTQLSEFAQRLGRPLTLPGARPGKARFS